MALNFLQALMSQGPGLDGSDVGETPPPTNLLAGVPGYGPESAPDFSATPDAPITTLPDTSSMLQQMGGSANVSPAPVSDQPAEAPRERRSILDTVGRLADVFAKVGGAEALYQPTLDAREDRAIALGDHARSVDLDKIKLATAQGTLDDAARARLAQAVRGTQALLAANPQADVSKIFPMLAARAGVDPTQAATLAGEIANNPGLLDGLAGFDDSSDKYGGNVVYGKDKNGNVVPFQMNLKGGSARAILPDGFTPVDPLKFVDTGGAQIGVDPRTGKPVTTLNKSADPNTVANNATREKIASGNNATAITVAGMPARAKPGATAKPDASAAGNSEALIALDNLENGFKDLDRIGALPGSKGGVVNNVIGALGRTAAGQYLGEQAGTEAAQKRVAMGKTINTLQQTLIKALPASATRTKFEQEILARSLPDPTRMSLKTAQDVINDYRGIFRRAQAAAAAEKGGASSASGMRKLPPRIGAPATSPKPAARRAPVGKPTVSNW